MKKILIIIVSIALALLAASFLYVKYVESDIENKFSSALASHNIQAKQVNYNLDTETLTIKGFEVNDFIFSGSKLYIDELIAHHPNAEAFDPKTTGHPLVAKQLTSKNTYFSYDIAGLAQKISYESLSISNWKQNIGKILELKKQGYNEEFFIALMDSFADEVVYVNCIEQAQTITDGITVDSITKTGQVSMKGLSPTNIDEFYNENIATTLTSGQTPLISYTIKNFNIKNIPAPAPSFWVAIMNILPNITDGTLTDEQEKDLFSVFGEYAKTFTKTNFDAEQLNLKLGAAENSLALQKFSLASNIDSEKQSYINLDAKIKGATVYIDNLALPSDLAAQLSVLLDKTALLDISATINLAEKKPSNLKLELGIQNGMHIQTKIDANLPDDVLPSLFSKTKFSELDADDFERWFENTKLVSIEKIAKDESMLSRILLLLSTQKNQDPIEFWQQNSPKLTELAKAQLPFLKEDDIETLYQCIDKPGTLKFNSTPTSPMNLPDALNSFLSNQDNINLAVSCTPGNSIIESVQKLTVK